MPDYLKHMEHTDSTGTFASRLTAGVVAFLGIYHGAAPLVARPVFGKDQRFAPALWLPSPWWWLTCLTIAIAAIALITIIETTHRQRATTHADVAADTDRPIEPHAPGSANQRSSGYDALAGLVFLAGLYNGVAPFVARLLFDSNLLLALPLRLPAPWWWITSLTVIAATIALLATIDHAKQHHTDE